MTLPAAIVTAVIGLMTVVGGGMWSFKRSSISGAKEVTESALLLIQPQNDRITILVASVKHLNASVNRLSLQVEHLEDHITSLSEQIVELGEVPRPLYRRSRPTTQDR